MMLQIIVDNTYVCFLRTYLIRKLVCFYCHVNNNCCCMSMPLWLYFQFTWVRYYNQNKMKYGSYSHSCKKGPISSLEWIIVHLIIGQGHRFCVYADYSCTQRLSCHKPCPWLWLSSERVSLGSDREYKWHRKSHFHA